MGMMPKRARDAGQRALLPVKTRRAPDAACETGQKPVHNREGHEFHRLRNNSMLHLILGGAALPALR